MPRLYELSLSPASLHTWRFAGIPPTFEEFSRNFDQGVHFQLVVARRDSHEPVGHVFTYNASARHSFAYLAVAVDPQLASTGLGIEALIIFVYYSFSVWPFHKLYFESLEPNWTQFSSGLTRDLFVEEGCLQGHALIEGRRTDMHLAAIYPEVLNNSFFQRVVRRFVMEDNRPSVVLLQPRPDKGTVGSAAAPGSGPTVLWRAQR